MQFARLCVAPRYWGITCQAIGELQLAGFCFASSYCGNIITLHFPKLLPHYNFESLVLCQDIGEFQLQFAWSCFAPSYWGITITTGTGDSGSSYFLDTRNQFSIAVHHNYILSAPLHAAIPVHLLWCLKHPPSCGKSISSYFLNTTLIWRSRIIFHLKHALSCGGFVSSCIFNLPPPMALPVHHFFARSICGDSSSPYILNRPPPLFRETGSYIYLKHSPSSHILNTPLHLPIPILHFR